MDSAIMHTVASNEDSMVMAVPEPSAAAVTNLKLLYQLGAALGSSFGVDQVLEVVMDLVFEHVKADRGMILLLDERSGELIPKVVRTREDDDKPEADAGPTPPSLKPMATPPNRRRKSMRRARLSTTSSPMAKECFPATRWPIGGSAAAKAYTTWASAARYACRSRRES